jgi:hypothetical protein
MTVLCSLPLFMAFQKFIFWGTREAVEVQGPGEMRVALESVENILVLCSDGYS